MLKIDVIESWTNRWKCKKIRTILLSFFLSFFLSLSLFFFFVFPFINSFRLSHKQKMLHLLWVLIFTFTQLNQARFTVYQAQGQTTKSLIFRLMSFLHVLINFVRLYFFFFLKINCLIYTCMNAFKAGHITIHTYIYTWLSSKHIIIIRMMDELKLVMCTDRLFDHRRFRLLFHLFVQFNSALCDIDFFGSLNGLS